jgi:hypothetical protein
MQADSTTIPASHYHITCASISPVILITNKAIKLNHNMVRVVTIKMVSGKEVNEASLAWAMHAATEGC